MENPLPILALLPLLLASPELRANAADFTPVIRRVEDLIRSEFERSFLTGVSVALVDDQTTVLAYGYGLADKDKKVPATGKTVYRVGSISKLFTALSAMQLVEQGRLDLDKPVSDYCPDFRIVDPFPDADPVTLRQLMCHRSGLVRESPVGGYLDPAQPSIQASVASLADCVRVHPPDEVTRYSNIGVTVVGHAVAAVADMPFAEYQRSRVLDPMGMNSSSYIRDDRVRLSLAASYMPVADGKGGFRRIESPVFELGTIPAGNLYSNVEDLARFLACIFARGQIDGRRVVKPETLDEMFTPQLTGEDTGFGLGFNVGNFRDRKLVSHTGAVYGFSSSLSAIPELKVGVVVLANEDLASGPVRRIANNALGWMVDTRLGLELAPEEAYADVPKDLAESLAGQYESESYWASLRYSQGRLLATISGQELVVRQSPQGDLVLDGRWKYNAPVELEHDADGNVVGFDADQQTFCRVTAGDAAEIPAPWKRFLGSYGPEFIPLVVSVRHGHLYAMTENMVDYRLTPVNRLVFRLPKGMYEDEQLVFQVGPTDRVSSAVLAGMVLPRTSP
ncbi:MAG: serine hydrolase domain-containing protein [Thermoguttaceae bacterium]